MSIPRCYQVCHARYTEWCTIKKSSLQRLAVAFIQWLPNGADKSWWQHQSYDATHNKSSCRIIKIIVWQLSSSSDPGYGCTAHINMNKYKKIREERHALCGTGCHFAPGHTWSKGRCPWPCFGCMNWMGFGMSMSVQNIILNDSSALPFV